MKVFLDANILFSSANPHSHLARLLHDVLAAGSIFTSRYAYEEAQRNLAAKRVAWLPGLEQWIAQVQWVVGVAELRAIDLADKDRPILGAAIYAGCDYLLTGDKKDFGHLYGSTLSGVAIVSPAMLAAIMS